MDVLIGNKQAILGNLEEIKLRYKKAIRELWETSDPLQDEYHSAVNSKIGLLKKLIKNIDKDIEVITFGFK